MATGDIQQLPFGKDNPLYYSRPIWVTHTMHLDQLLTISFSLLIRAGAFRDSCAGTGLDNF